MKSTKKREIGVGDNLYGIPLDDILSPEQLEHMKKNPPSVQRRRIKRAEKKGKANKIKSPKFKLPEIKLNLSVLYGIIAAVIMLILFVILKNPIFARITPKMYVSDALEKSVSEICNESEDIAKNVFGFDIADAKKLTVIAGGVVGADSLNIVNNLSSEVMAGYSKKAQNASGIFKLVYDDEEFASGSVYLNNDEIGFNMPQLFGEFWVAPAAEIGTKWNDSGLRKALYAEPIGYDADFSFANLFRDRNILSEEGRKKARKLTKKIFSTAEADYVGKDIIDVDGKVKSGRKFKFTFEQSNINDYLVSMMELILKDRESSELLSYMNKLTQAETVFADISGRLADSIDIGEANVYFLEYNGAIHNIQVGVEYSENDANPRISMSLSSGNTKNMTDSLTFAMEYYGTGKDMACYFSTAGNHSGKGEMFTDNTSFEISNADYTYALTNELTMDFKSGSVNGKIVGTDVYSTKTLSFSGECSKKRSLEIKLSDMWATVAGGVNRKLTGNGYIKIEPDMTVPKFSTSNKKLILDYTKAEAESYIARLEETDNVKKYLETVNKIFKNNNSEVDNND